MRLINADSLMAYLEKQRQASKGYEQWTLARIIALIDKQPTIDLEEIIDKTLTEWAEQIISEVEDNI